MYVCSFVMTKRPKVKANRWLYDQESLLFKCYLALLSEVDDYVITAGNITVDMYAAGFVTNSRFLVKFCKWLVAAITALKRRLTGIILY